MSPQSNSRRISTWIGWLIAALLLVLAGWTWIERQFVIDVIQYSQFTPSNQVSTITDRLSLTDDAKFTFYASHPVIETKEKFNRYCERREASSPILGCYGGGRIYIYDITDSRLDGIKEVTAAHELLHAVYERLNGDEKKRIDSLLEAAYGRLVDGELKERMNYYDKNEPGETYNELHSIIPTEFADIGAELEQYYSKYFTNRQAIVQLHSKVETQFTQLSQEANSLVEQINALVASINNDTDQYNKGVASLNQKIASFNARAGVPGGFRTQADFNAERASLEAEQRQLDSLRGRVMDNTDKYKQLRTQLDAINTETESLNESIDSVLSDEPNI